MEAAFREREFEFCFNSEFVRKKGSALVGTPLIPTTRAERFKGYDVEFPVKHGGYRYSIFLQHKVPDYVDRRTSTNRRFMDRHPGGAYFRFRVRHTLKSQQHNLLVRLASASGRYVVAYCAPRFYTYEALYNYVKKSEVTEQCSFTPTRGLPELSVSDRVVHHISLDPDGRRWHFHSEPVPIAGGYSWEEFLGVEQQAIVDTIDEAYLHRLNQDMKATI